MIASPRRVRFTAALLLLALGAANALHAQTAHPTGAWRLDTVRSDSLHLPFREPGDSTGPRPIGPPGEGRGGEGPGSSPAAAGGASVAPGMEGGPGYSGGRYRRGMTDKELERIRQTLALARKAPATIEIDAEGRSVKLTDRLGFETTLAIDGRRSCESVYDGSEICTRASWSDETLVIERRVDGGGRVTERYTLGLGGIRLLSFVQVDGLLQPLEFTRQFER